MPLHVAEPRACAGGWWGHGPPGPPARHACSHSVPLLAGLRFGPAFSCPDFLWIWVSQRRGYLSQDLTGTEGKLFEGFQRARPGQRERRERGSEQKHVRCLQQQPGRQCGRSRVRKQTGELRRGGRGPGPSRVHPAPVEMRSYRKVMNRGGTEPLCCCVRGREPRGGDIKGPSGRGEVVFEIHSEAGTSRIC